MLTRSTAPFNTFIQSIFVLDAGAVKIRVLLRALAVALAALHVFAAISSQSMNADGISYLDIGDAYFRADWANAINPVWSPLYSWILGFGMWAFRPEMAWEFPTVHLINFFIYLGTIASFEFLWANVRRSHASQADGATFAMPGWLWWTLGYLLFIWTTLSLIQIWAVTPDMLMAAILMLAAGIIARIRAGDYRQRTFLILGLLLGLGYLSKTFMLSIALVFLVLSVVVQKRTRAAVTNTLLAAAIFLLISLPFIYLISDAKGKFTIGESGTVTFLRYVNGMPFPHWQGDPENGIILKHPSRVIHTSPPIYAFGEPVGGSYPISIDPSYWYEGVEPRLDIAGLLGRMYTSGLVYVELFFQQQGILLACVLALYAMGPRRAVLRYANLQRWALVIPAAAAFGLYSIVLVEGRYIGIFVLLFWADILANIRLPDVANNRAWMNTLGVIAAAGLLIPIMLFNLDGVGRLNTAGQFSSGVEEAPNARPLEVALALKQLGVRAGDRVGVIGYAYDSFWARMTRTRIAAEMLDTDAEALWRGDSALQQSVLQAFASTGASAVVAEYVPGYARLDGWQRVGSTNYFIYVFAE
jgi:4-amino-4-deoxy-L-arabinose transferase-like glycosyltransferase